MWITNGSHRGHLGRVGHDRRGDPRLPRRKRREGTPRATSSRSTRCALPITSELFFDHVRVPDSNRLRERRPGRPPRLASTRPATASPGGRSGPRSPASRKRSPSPRPARYSAARSPTHADSPAQDGGHVPADHAGGSSCRYAWAVEGRNGDATIRRSRWPSGTTSAWHSTWHARHETFWAAAGSASSYRPSGTLLISRASSPTRAPRPSTSW